MPRLFVAVWPPDEVLDRVGALPRPDVAGLRWTRREQWHVTLRFLGHVDDATEVVRVLTALEASPAEAVAGPAVGRFGRRVLHVPVGGLERLAAAVVAATAGLGRPPEDRPIAGPLTQARVAGRARVDLAPLVGAPVAGRWAAEEVCLVASRLSPAGARYEVLDRFPLAPPNR
jgi:2'-5' RNA ligase